MTLAEHYHHKYRIRSTDEVRHFLATTYPEIKAFADSTVAMRLNALAGDPPAPVRARLLADLSDFGLPPKLEARFR
jgi:hypothetical protein